ncbi:unnamed protein product, partial [Angiostrongylus costaricensis]|uniref:Thioredoxin domain-containing protein n=1 Tax=Angiostrongylus costaricensis TaxID=334426 RepID=A0A0R3PR22_ANGCS
GEFDAILKENPSTLVVIDFYATWCGPCKIIGPKFMRMSDEFTSVIFIKVDVDESVRFSFQYRLLFILIQYRLLFILSMNNHCFGLLMSL